jgi:flagellar biosynthesis protein FlhG
MSIKYVQKVRFYRHIKHLEADYILLDLGGGSNLNTIDTFLLADKMIVVIVPEITAIENLYHFLKRALFRKMNIILRKHRLDETTLSSWEKQYTDEIKSIGGLLRSLKNISVEASLIIDQELADFKIYLIVNQARNREHIEMGFSVRSVIIKYFGIAARYVGYIEYNDLFWKSINTIQPLSQTGVSLANNHEIAALTHNLAENKQITLTGINHA